MFKPFGNSEYTFQISAYKGTNLRGVPCVIGLQNIFFIPPDSGLKVMWPVTYNA